MNLRKWKNLLIDAMEKDILHEETDFSPDHPSCPRCGGEMDFHGYYDEERTKEIPIGEGYWECDDCGFEVSERDLR